MKTLSNFHIQPHFHPDASSGIGKLLSLTACLLVLIILKSEQTFSQEIEWQKTIGGSGDEKICEVLHTSDGGYLLAGYTVSGSSGLLSEGTHGGKDYLIIKLNHDGDIEWQNTIGGNGDDELISVDQTFDGGFILGGTSHSDSSGDKSQQSRGSVDYWIVKTDSNGVIQWDKTIGGSEEDFLYSIEQTSDNGFILGGSSNSNISGDKTENNKGWIGQYNNNMRDYWIVKTDSSGNIQWQNTIGGFLDEFIRSVHSTQDAGYILTGVSNSSATSDKTEYAIGGLDAWIVKTDSLGNVVWDNTIGGAEYDYVYSSEVLDDGSLILGVISESGVSGDKTSMNLGSNDCWILKIDTAGMIQWQTAIGSNEMEINASLKQASNGDYFLGCASWSEMAGMKTEKSNYIDYWVVRMNPYGDIIWQNTIGGNYYDELTCLEVVSGEECIVAGNSVSPISYDKTANSFGGYDFWIVKLTEKFNLLNGKLFADFNSNGIKNFGEPSMVGKKVTEQGTGRFAFSQIDGSYSLVVLDSGSYTVSTPSVLWYNQNPAAISAYFSGINQTDSLNDFAYQPIGNFDDVCVTITPLGAFRSGFSATYQISYGNYGTTTIAPTVYFYPDPNVTFQSATLTPSQVTPDSVVWSLQAMLPFQTGSFIVTVNVNLGLPIGTLINSSAHIEPYLTDANPSCNNSNWEVFVTGSFDPNDILVNEDTLTTTQLSTAPWLEYIIRFQNTGNDTAFTVKILNPIDTNKLDLSSIEFVNASHPVNINWINYQRNMEFKFDNILLPDSNTNEPLSHGFVRYRIQPKTTLNAGDTIPNFAAIYFDFNDPVITNTAKTIIVLPTGLEGTNTSPGKLLVFPNPAENSISISGIQLENGRAILRLTDLYGKLHLETNLTTTTTEISVDNLPAGVYFLQSGELRATFMKQ